MRNRVKEVRLVKASELRANPRNWRLHPDEQRAALGAMLEDVGMVTTLIARETKDGLELIDGHLRADLANDAEVSVAIVDLDDDEAARVLATFDPLSEMALVDSQKLEELLGLVEKDDDHAEFRRLVSDLHRRLAKEEADPEDVDSKKEVPGMELMPNEHYDFIVILATTVQEWNILTERLGLVPTAQRKGRMGIGRAIRADKLLTILNKERDGQSANLRIASEPPAKSGRKKKAAP